MSDTAVKAVSHLQTSTVEVAPALAPAAGPVANEGLMQMAFKLYVLAAVLGLGISRNERASADDNKKMVKHWNKTGVDSTKGQGTSGLVVAVAAFGLAIGAFNYPKSVTGESLKKLSELTPQILGMWTQSYGASSQEAQGKSGLIQIDLQNPARGADSFRSNVEDTSKNLCQNIFQLVASAAKGQ